MGSAPSAKIASPSDFVSESDCEMSVDLEYLDDRGMICQGSLAAAHSVAQSQLTLEMPSKRFLAGLSIVDFNSGVKIATL